MKDTRTSISKQAIEEERIEEMAQDMYDLLPDYDVNRRDCTIAAAGLFAKGYRRQIEGHWITPTIISGRAFNIPHCSACEGIPCGVDENTKFCPNCGARMEGADS